jgi:hypothetical protein
LYSIESGIFRALTLTCATAANASLEADSIDITRVPNFANNLGDAASNARSSETKVFIAYRIIVAKIIERANDDLASGSTSPKTKTPI